MPWRPEAHSCAGSRSPMRVVYIDGEMPAVTMQERLAAIVNSHEAEAADDALLIVTPGYAGRGAYARPSTIEGQAAIAPLLEGVRLIVVDNTLSTLCRTGTENEPDSWDVVQMWALEATPAPDAQSCCSPCRETGTMGQRYQPGCRDDV